MQATGRGGPPPPVVLGEAGARHELAVAEAAEWANVIVAAATRRAAPATTQVHRLYADGHPNLKALDPRPDRLDA